MLAQGYGSPEHFFEYAKATLDRLRDDGDDGRRMMSIGLHPRFSGQPARARTRSPRFIDYAQGLDEVVFMRRVDIARSFAEQVPAPSTRSSAS